MIASSLALIFTHSLYFLVLTTCYILSRASQECSGVIHPSSMKSVIFLPLSPHFHLLHIAQHRVCAMKKRYDYSIELVATESVLYCYFSTPHMYSIGKASHAVYSLRSLLYWYIMHWLVIYKTSYFICNIFFLLPGQSQLFL